MYVIIRIIIIHSRKIRAVFVFIAGSDIFFLSLLFVAKFKCNRLDALPQIGIAWFTKTKTKKN